MHLTGLDIVVIAAFFAINLGIGVYYARRKTRRRRVLPLGPQSAVVADRDLDGRDDLRRRHAARRDRLRRRERHRGQLAVVEHGRQRSADGVLLRRAVAPLGRAHRRRVHRAALRRRSPQRGCAACARSTKACIVNTIIMGWVNLAMVKVLSLTLHVPTTLALYVCLVLTALYVTIGGLVVGAGDRHAAVHREDVDGDRARDRRGRRGRRHRCAQSEARPSSTRRITPSGGGSLLSFFPTGDASWMPLTTFLVFIGVAWWASSYPGAEPGGGSYIAQRIFASQGREERGAGHAVLQRRALRAAAVAVDSRRAVRARALPARRDRRRRQGSTPSWATCKRWSTICRRRCAG